MPRVQSTHPAVCARGGHQRVRVAGSATPPKGTCRACKGHTQGSVICGLDPGGDHRVYDDEMPAASAKLASAHARSVRDRMRVATAYQWATGKAAGGALGGDGSVPIRGRVYRSSRPMPALNVPWQLPVGRASDLHQRRNIEDAISQRAHERYPAPIKKRRIRSKKTHQVDAFFCLIKPLPLICFSFYFASRLR